MSPCLLPRVGPGMPHAVRCPPLCSSPASFLGKLYTLQVPAVQAVSLAKPPALYEAPKQAQIPEQSAETLPQFTRPACCCFLFTQCNSSRVSRQVCLLSPKDDIFLASEPWLLRRTPWGLPSFLLSADPSPSFIPCSKFTSFRKMEDERESRSY